MDTYRIKNYQALIDIDEVACDEITATTCSDRMMFSAMAVDVEELLEQIGEETVRKYFKIPEEE